MEREQLRSDWEELEWVRSILGSVAEEIQDDGDVCTKYSK